MANSTKVNNPKLNLSSLKSNVDVTFIALMAIFITSVAYDYYWVNANTVPPAWDESNHMVSSLAYYNVLTNPSADMLGKMLSIDKYYPPLYHLSAGIFYLFFGTSSDASIMVNTIYLGILLFSVYGLGSRLFDKRTGFTAALLISLFPAVSDLQRDFLIDFALISLVSLTLYLLVASEDFKNRRYSLMFGAAFALSMLAKWTAVFFIIGPLGYVLLNAFVLSRRNNNRCYYCGKDSTDSLVYSGHRFCSNACKKEWIRHKKPTLSNPDKQLVNFAFSLIVAIILAGIWYIPNIYNVYNSVFVEQQSIGAFEGDPEIFTVQSFFYYIYATFNAVSMIFLLLAAAGLIVLLKKKNNSPSVLYLVIIIPYIVFTLFRNKDGRYILPIIVSLSLIGAVFLSSIKDKKLFSLAIVLVALFGIIQIFPQGTGLKSMSIQVSYGPLYLFGPEAVPPVDQDWKVRDVLQDILNDARNSNRVLTRGSGYIGVIPDMKYVNGLTYNYYSYSNKLPFNIFNCVYIGFDNFASNLFNFDYILVRDGKNQAGPYDKISDDMRDYFYRNKGDKYVLLKQYELPDNTTLFTYKNSMT